VFKCLGGFLAFGAGGGDIVVPGGVGAEVALPRSHLVEAARGELVEAHKRVRFEGGAVWVSVRTRRGLVPFLHEEVVALELELGVGASRRGLGVVIDEQVLRGDWEGAEPVGAQEKEHGGGLGFSWGVWAGSTGGGAGCRRSSRLGPCGPVSFDEVMGSAGKVGASRPRG